MPLRLSASGTRTTANVSRGLMYAGMYGMCGPVPPGRAGLLATAYRALLPSPCRREYCLTVGEQSPIRRIHPKALIMGWHQPHRGGPAHVEPLHAGNTYLQIFVSLVLLGAGWGTAPWCAG